MKTVFTLLAVLLCGTCAAPLEGQDEALTKPDGDITETKHETDQLSDERRKVAFSVGSGIQGTFGPFNTEINLNFNKVLTNVGNAYSAHTGIFKAPVRGVYHFSASAFGNSNIYMEMYLMKNGERVFGMSESPKGSNMSISRAVNLLLEPGDEIYLRLKANCQIYDDGQTYNSFSGFLLFPV